MKVLLSIKPEFVEKIFSGEKKFEYRRTIFKDNTIETIVVYCTMPIGKVVGEIKIEEILNLDIDALWDETKDKSGIKYDFFKSYFHDKESGYAIKFKDVIEYDYPLTLSDLKKGLKPPQSFCYID
ncbi:ASCH domain-containing protein [Lysinibacillus tabacifolii]|uniref:ASCH domain-containing protein n=1 Tax=Lysinibacillus tabacifolii TaxID=1173107 RepID=A0ABY2T4V4_9BACI|nr:ASCH domain-containing protein [Lysinibacillus tabacifolii]TKI50560.1 ASCH domain-containing protein [Lysinibacillus tabacifolii]